MGGGLQEAPGGPHGLPGLEERGIGDDEDERCGVLRSKTAGDCSHGGVGNLQEMEERGTGRAGEWREE